MSFLTPLYILGALSVGLPILFHLIQRRPRGDQVFSSLMFLSPSPPRLTRRSRLDHLLLLLIRASILVLLAMAFARPFLRDYLQRTDQLPSRRVVVLTDTSASMRRGDLWQQAVATVVSIAEDLDAHDRLALLTFDSKVDTLLPMSSQASVGIPHRARVEQSLGSVQPSWNETDLGQAIVMALETLQTGEPSEGELETAGQIVLISDLQKGSRLTDLDGISWPENVRMDVRTLECDKPSNAGLARLANLPAASADDADHTAEEEFALRIRVHNDQRSTTEQFQLRWQRSDGQPGDSPTYSVRVPPGQYRVVRVKPDPDSSSLVLSGDDHSFDNRLFVARPTPAQKRLLYLGLETDDSDSLYYFLKRAELGTARYDVQLEARWPAAGLEQLVPKSTPLVVATQPPGEQDIVPLHDFLNAGGNVLIVLDERNSSDRQMQSQIAKLLQMETVGIDEWKVDDYAMFGKIDFQHPMFRPLADRRFNDFTKIRVWKHRRLTSDHEQPWQVLMQFDNGHPALVERSIGEGHVWILTTGWQPSESQLALSTKFIPMLAGMLGEVQEADDSSFDYPVGHEIQLRNIAEHARITIPSGETVALTSPPFVLKDTQKPGIYAIMRDDQPDEFAVNVALSESRTAPLDVVELERRGARLGEFLATDELKMLDRQAKDIELESRQQLWRWLIVAALSLMIVEIILSGRLSRFGPTTAQEDV